MKPSLALFSLIALSALPMASAKAADVGVSIHIAQPGVYGRVDIGRFPQPVVVYPQPVYVVRPARVEAPPPVYMWVPPGHQKKWHKHCASYGACGAPVYFVRDRWYHDHVHRGHGKGRGHGRDRDRDRDGDD